MRRLASAGASLKRGFVRIEILPDADTAAHWAAAFIAARARQGVRERGRFACALSGGATSLTLLAALARQRLPWGSVDLFQSDERAAPRHSADRNYSQLDELLISQVGLSPRRVHAMLTDGADLTAAAAAYADVLTAVAGIPPILDLIHLGLGSDGHTASLVPGDPALDLVGGWVAVTRPYHGRRRLTLTLPTLAQARCVLWLVCGARKADALLRLANGDDGIPAGRVPRDRALIVADAAAAANQLGAA